MSSKLSKWLFDIKGGPHKRTQREFSVAGFIFFYSLPSPPPILIRPCCDYCDLRRVCRKLQLRLCVAVCLSVCLSDFFLSLFRTDHVDQSIDYDSPVTDQFAFLDLLFSTISMPRRHRSFYLTSFWRALVCVINRLCPQSGVSYSGIIFQSIYYAFHRNLIRAKLCNFSNIEAKRFARVSDHLFRRSYVTTNICRWCHV